MIIDLFAFSVALLGLIALGLIVVKKFPVLASIDVTQSSKSLRERKISILEQRLRRKFVGAWGKVSANSQPVASNVKGWMSKAHDKLVDLEHEYKVRSLPVLLNRHQRRAVNTEIHDILEQAEALLHEGEYTAAEEKALQAVRLEPRSVPAFELLGGLYLQTKEYGHAKEVYLYLLKLTGDNDAIYEHLGEAELGEGHLEAAKQDFTKTVDLHRTVMAYHLELASVYRLMADWPNALKSIRDALTLDPKNPKVLDEYLEICIGGEKRRYAAEALDMLQEVNPENSKIPEWGERIMNLPAQPPEELTEEPVEIVS